MTIQAQILQRLRRNGRGKVFTTKDFLDVGTRDAADQALSRLARSGKIKRLGRGLYFYPRVNPRLNLRIGPDADAIAEAVARQTGSQVIPSGATAANHLGLSTQVPAQPVYLTDGRSRKISVGNFCLVLKHVAPKELPVGSPQSAQVFQALRFLGRDAIDRHVVAKLRRVIAGRHRRELLRDARYAADWIGDVVREVARAPGEEAIDG
jgi:hypothetical protein